jgi:uncharacterized protein (TIGR03437 family)
LIIITKFAMIRSMLRSLLPTVFLAALIVQPTSAQPSAVPKFTILTIAGNGITASSGDGGPATSASLAEAIGVAYDRFGNVYVCDNNRIRRVSPDGTITTIAGTGTAGYSGDGGPAVNAMLNSPDRVSVDNQGVVYIPDTLNFRIRKVTLDGIITTVAGNGIAGFGGDGGPAINAQIRQPDCTGSDAAGDLFFCDFGNNRIRMISPSGTLTTVAGNGQAGFSGDGGLATSASLNGPAGLAVEGSVLYISDGNNRIRKVVGGIITTIAGNGTAGYTGDGGPATSAELSTPAAIAAVSGTVYIPDRDNNVIRVVLPDGTIHTVAGNGIAGFGGDLGPATQAELNSPRAVAVTPSGGVYIGDGGNKRIRLLVPPPSISAGGITPIYSPANTIQPGSWISIYGSNFATIPAIWNGDFPTKLGGVSVTINSRPAYLWYVSPGQLNVQAPDDTATGTVPVVVTTPFGTASSTVTLGPYAPSFSLFSGKYPAAIVGTSGPGNSGAGYDYIGPAGAFSFPSRPVAAGETIILFGVGFGPTSPTVKAGQAFSGAAPCPTLPQFTIGGVPATVAFAGIVEAGLYQFNVVVPSAGSGDQLLQASIGGQTTPAGIYVTIH